MLRRLPYQKARARERRRFHRLLVNLPAKLLSTALGRVDATVIDFSQAGCCIRTRARCYRGDHLVLTIQGLAPRAVKAAWRGDGVVGLAFADPLSWAVVMQLAFPGGLTAK